MRGETHLCWQGMEEISVRVGVYNGRLLARYSVKIYKKCKCIPFDSAITLPRTLSPETLTHI